MRKAMMFGAMLLASGAPAMAQQTRPETPAMLFFDWGKPDINGDAAIVLDQIANAYRARAGGLIVSGHSDRSGGAAPNRQSSRKRALAARDYLVAHGVPASAMTIEAFGEERPLVATEDGVREPQNRRVEIRPAA